MVVGHESLDVLFQFGGPNRTAFPPEDPGLTAVVGCLCGRAGLGTERWPQRLSDPITTSGLMT